MKKARMDYWSLEKEIVRAQVGHAKILILGDIEIQKWRLFVVEVRTLGGENSCTLALLGLPCLEANYMNVERTKQIIVTLAAFTAAMQQNSIEPEKFLNNFCLATFYRIPNWVEKATDISEGSL